MNHYHCSMLISLKPWIGTQRYQATYILKFELLAGIPQLSCTSKWAFPEAQESFRGLSFSSNILSTRPHICLLLRFAICITLCSLSGVIGALHSFFWLLIERQFSGSWWWARIILLGSGPMPMTVLVNEMGWLVEGIKPTSRNVEVAWGRWKPGGKPRCC